MLFTLFLSGVVDVISLIILNLLILKSIMMCKFYFFACYTVAHAAQRVQPACRLWKNADN